MDDDRKERSGFENVGGCAGFIFPLLPLPQVGAVPRSITWYQHREAEECGVNRISRKSWVDYGRWMLLVVRPSQQCADGSKDRRVVASKFLCCEQLSNHKPRYAVER